MGHEGKKYGYGYFGNLGKQYAEARQGFPEEVISWLWSFLPNRNAHILDLGCGTGISTRQIAERGGIVVGCDKDELMIAEAKKTDDGLEYLVATAENLPYNNAEFYAVTAFSAFHWFANEKAISEIKRILKPKGVMYVVNKNDIGDFKKGYKEIIRSVLQQDLPEAKKNYLPEKFLAEKGFEDIQVKDFETSEYFTLPQAIDYLQSVSIWNLVPNDLKLTTLESLENYCKSHLMKGMVERKLNVRVVTACMG